MLEYFPRVSHQAPVGDTSYSVSYSAKVTLALVGTSAFVDRLNALLAERVGFEPTGVVSSHKISSLGRYDRFGTSPCDWMYFSINPIYIFNSNFQHVKEPYSYINNIESFLIISNYFTKSLSISFDGLFKFHVMTISSVLVFDGSITFFLFNHSETFSFTFASPSQLFG